MRKYQSHPAGAWPGDCPHARLRYSTAPGIPPLFLITEGRAIWLSMQLAGVIALRTQ